MESEKESLTKAMGRLKTHVLEESHGYEHDAQYAQSDHDGGRCPRDVIEHSRVDVLAHDLLVVRDDEHID
jgi:hypothetical protein